MIFDFDFDLDQSIWYITGWLPSHWLCSSLWQREGGNSFVVCFRNDNAISCVNEMIHSLFLS